MLTIENLKPALSSIAERTYKHYFFCIKSLNRTQMCTIIVPRIKKQWRQHS